MIELYKYILRTFSFADATRVTLTIFLISLVHDETGPYTTAALGIIFFRYEITTFVERWKREIIQLPDQFLQALRSKSTNEEK